MLISLIVAIWYSILKHLLIKHFSFIPVCELQMLTHTTAMSDLGETLIIQGWKTKTTLSKIWTLLISLLIMSYETKRLVSSMKYRISKILRYDFDCGSLRLMILFESTLFSSFIYFYTMLKSKKAAILLVIITTSLLLEWI